MKPLSKSQYVRGIQCEKSLWLYRHRKDLRTTPDTFQESIMESGTEFGILARQLWSGGVLIEADHLHPEDALTETQKAIASGAHTIYEAAFFYNDILVRVDVLRRMPSHATSWAIYEVKSGTKVEDVHLDDVAIQRYVLEGAGQHVQQSFVVHANGSYIRRGALDLAALFMPEDVTKESAERLVDVPKVLEAMKAYADAQGAPTKGIGSHCTKPYECDFKAHCWAHVPEYSVFNLAYAKMPQKLEMFNKGVQRIEQINPDMHKLTAGQRTQVELARSGKPRVDVGAVKAFLKNLRYPLTHLDFETDNPVVPPFDGLRPYQQMPFQAVVCVQDEPGAPVVEHGFLGDGLKDPRPALAEFLVDHVARSGSIIAYHKSFECGRLEELASFFWMQGKTDKSSPLKLMIERLWDLADPFRTNAYTHPDFRGRWSIKAVLPVLVPSMTYKGLEIGDGAAAMAAYAKLRDPKLPAAERARLIAALKVYCGQDVVAMVKILEHLYDVVAGKVPAGKA